MKQDLKKVISQMMPTKHHYVAVEEMPMFPGGDAALLKYIAENTIYPETQKNRIFREELLYVSV